MNRLDPDVVTTYRLLANARDTTPDVVERKRKAQDFKETVDVEAKARDEFDHQCRMMRDCREREDRAKWGAAQDERTLKKSLIRVEETVSEREMCEVRHREAAAALKRRRDERIESEKRMRESVGDDVANALQKRKAALIAMGYDIREWRRIQEESNRATNDVDSWGMPHDSSAHSYAVDSFYSSAEDLVIAAVKRGHGEALGIPENARDAVMAIQNVPASSDMRYRLRERLRECKLDYRKLAEEWSRESA